MKKIKFLVLSVLVMSAFMSCVDDDNDELTGGALTGGLVNLTNPSVGYVVGNNATYTLFGTVLQTTNATTNIDVYKSFTSVTDGTSEEVFHTSIPISNTTPGETADFSFSVTYEDLIAGLTLNGSPLPASDGELNIGDGWTIRFLSTTSDGGEVMNSSTALISVGTRFAGKYATVEALYYRINVLTYTEADWPDVTEIQSVDATTYRVVEYFGAFNGNEWYFQIDENDKISYPDETPDGDAQTGNGQPLVTCQSNPSYFADDGLPCGADANVVVRDDVAGKDRLYMTYGYFTSGSGPRTFWQVMEKIPE